MPSRTVPTAPHSRNRGAGRPRREGPAGDAVVARIREGVALFDRTVHLGGSTAVALDGDRATARAAQLSTHALADPPGELFVSGGHADTELVRTPDDWRIAATALRIAWTRGTPPRLPAAAAPGDTI
ncbi:nuclear transport factor 2 family protein [Streptomyces sp. RS10V-4]|uniref:nuclear transport factor 2 family protein n=1 Tax=Streptomyces rhizoryzae TaxID=2932493 RepID=UPI0020051C3C|nr:nuclear transport factor 2 family protein [Streptomyces rhizoryzae]MCK7625983.1 nuclear transport factor 2 family protein [Streptomyces rhizoryzae]